MTTTPDLFTEALHAQARLSDLSDQMAEAKCDLQRAVVKLNESGVSLREIADALHLSHQRVHQIIGSRPQRPAWARLAPWRQQRRQARINLACSFCGRSESLVAKLVAGPRVYICDGCALRADAVTRGHVDDDAFAPLRLARGDESTRCSFCGKRSPQVAAMVAARGRAICQPCLDLCFEIMELSSGGR